MKVVMQKNLRKLVIKNKISSQVVEHVMEHNSVIIFDLKFNRENHHKIVLSGNSDSFKWLGITFRTSKTFITFKDSIPYFLNNNVRLYLAKTIDEVKEFYKLRGEENKTVAKFNYPEILYTISESDLKEIL